MALARTLSIYKATYDAAVTLFRLTAGFRRDLRPSVGRRIEECALEMARLIVAANAARGAERTALLLRFATEWETLEFLLSMARELRLISDGQEAETARLMDAIGRQATAWRKTSERKGGEG